MLRGGHIDHRAKLVLPDGTLEPSAEEVSPGRWKTTINDRRGFEPGDVIDRYRDLISMFGRRKYELVTDDDDDSTSNPKLNEKLLTRMTNSELRDFAAGEGIQLGSANSKSEIVEVITTGG